ncbi:hypothetical protein HYW19_01505 [Candidatus Woesearchaeota archaeon]|nr:hypothetical protein [Candidatus Woesearchaeota archaeon]
MPVSTAPLNKSQQIGGDHLGEVIAFVLTLKNVGASDGLVSMAISGAKLPEEVEKSAKILSRDIQPRMYSLDTKYQPQPSYPLD